MRSEGDSRLVAPISTHSLLARAALRRARVRARDERGVALVEFALLLPVLVVLLFGMLDFGKAFNYWIDGTHLANEGARWAVVNRNPSTSGETLQQYIRAQGTTAEYRDGGTASVPDALKVCITFPNGTSNVGDPVRVTVKTTYRWMSVLTAEVPGLTDTILQGTSTMRLEVAPTNYSVANNPAGC
jgi:Flp pilus assembly protein TadG